ncbi:DUF2066 domain-containing protein [Marinicellulosiphila megalodicopiae]|uniref:DUF2066 domain-containing protein n=1 Tax=Marinicellulosiphila megalodicopiae TaxID=2724896 RepID=UPI003BAEAF11
MQYNAAFKIYDAHVMKTLFKFFILIFVIFQVNIAAAVQQVDIYTQSVLIEKNASATRVNEIRMQALLQALQAATLKTDIERSSIIQSGLKLHKQYILSEKVRASDEVFTSVIGQQISMVELVIAFDSKKVNQLLLKANLSTLDAKRPETLAVILVQNKDGTTKIMSRDDLYEELTDGVASSTDVISAQQMQDRQFLENNIEGGLPGAQTSVNDQMVFYPQILQTMEREAAALKLPIVWPMMDPQDLFFFNQGDFWQVNKESILGFAKRYKTQVVLIARIKEHDDGRFIGEWNVLDLGRPNVQYYSTLESFSLAGLKQLSQAIMQQYGINPNDKKDEQVLIRMKNVTSIFQFHQNEVYLKQLSGVQSVTALNVDNQEVNYLLQLNVSQKQFLTNLQLNENIDFLIEDELRRPVLVDVVINDFE